MQRSDVLVCQHCGIMVEALRAGEGTLNCCNEPMRQLTANTVDAAREKHVPIIQQIDGGIKVTVGSVLHPMEEKHWIEFIEVLADGKVYRQYLSPGDAPEAFFPVTATTVSAREHCNLHGLWKGDMG